MNNRARFCFVAIVMLAGSSLACGGGDGSCGVAPCGGDVVGTWQASGGCVNDGVLRAQLASGCPGMSLGSITFNPSGSFTFANSSTFTGSLTLSTTVVINFPSSCTGGLTCAELAADLQADIGADGVASCTGTSACVCTMSGEDILSGPGTYTINGTTMMVTDSAGTSDGGPYCVQGSTLHLLELDTSMSMGSMGSAVIETDITMIRQ
jgi:hypothetical protein